MPHRSQIHQGYAGRIASALIAVLLMVSVGYLGVRNNSSGKAAALRQIAVSPATGTWTQGSTVSVSIRENSGTQPITSAQVSLSYSKTQLEYAGFSESGEFDSPTSQTMTCVPSGAACTQPAGSIRITRKITSAGQGITGEHAIITLNFRVLGNSGSTALTISDFPASNMLSRFGANMLTSVAGGSYTLMPSFVPDASLNLFPESGTYSTGATIPIFVHLHSPTQNVYTIHTVLVYPAAQLQYISTTSSSAFPVQTATTNTSGTLDLTRKVGAGVKGFLGDADVATVNFKVIGKTGTAALSIKRVPGSTTDSGALDSNNANILKTVGGASFVITAPATGGIVTPPTVPPTPSIPPVSTRPPVTAPPVVVSSPAVVSGKTSFSTTDGGHVSLNGTDTQIDGAVALTPVTDSSVLAKDPTDSVQSVQYWLNGKLIATQHTAPFAYNFDTKKLRNGSYELTIKTVYTSGTTTTSKQKVQVKNPVNVSYVLAHYSAGIAGSLVGLVIIAVLVWRFVLPHVKRSTEAIPAMATPGGFPAYSVQPEALIQQPQPDAAMYTTNASVIPPIAETAEIADQPPLPAIEYPAAETAPMIPPAAATAAPQLIDQPILEAPATAVPEVPLESSGPQPLLKEDGAFSPAYYAAKRQEANQELVVDPYAAPYAAPSQTEVGQESSSEPLPLGLDPKTGLPFTRASMAPPQSPETYAQYQPPIPPTPGS